jgi:large subunit ribosomal protein L25
MLQIDLSANVRSVFGKGPARTLRKGGLTPAILYGPKTEPVALSCDTKNLTLGLLSIHRHNAIINLDVDGKNHHVITKEIQTNPVMDTVEHVDFYEISLDAPMTFNVPLKISGKAKGVAMGGDMTVNMPAIPVKGKALDIPDFFELDVTPLELGASVTCGEVALPANVSLGVDSDKVCLAVSEAVEE